MPDDGRDELRQALRSFLTAHSPSDVVRGLMESTTGYDPEVWRQMAVELGLHGIGTPEELGGSGGTMEDLAVVFEEVGAALLCAPFFATVAMAMPAVMTSGDDAAIAELIPGFADGSRIGTLVLNGDLGPFDAATVALSATETRSGHQLDGSARMVLDGATADVILAAARGSAGTSLFAIDGTAAGLTRTPSASLDRTRKIAALQFDGVTARLIGAPGGADAGLQKTSDMAIIALAAEQVGAAQRCLDITVDYARQRVQFGRPIGSFQAIKHRCADMLVSVESARSASMKAAEVVAADRDDLAIAASVAKSFCSNAFVDAALDMMRVHGGIGFTWEHDAHLYVRRAKASQLMFGSPSVHTERLAHLVG